MSEILLHGYFIKTRIGYCSVHSLAVFTFIYYCISCVLSTIC